MPFIAAGKDFEVKIGLIGCGGRGTGAVLDALACGDEGDLSFVGLSHGRRGPRGRDSRGKTSRWLHWPTCLEDRLTHCAKQLDKLGVKIPQEARFTGFDAYKKLLAMPDVT